MTRFEQIKQMDIEELSDWISKNFEYENEGYNRWFDKKYCQNCEPVVGRYEDSNRDMEFGYCEFYGNCRYFQDRDDVPSQEEIIRMWLEEGES